MKANELMVGDIILYEYDKKRFPARVEEIYLDSVLVEEVNGEFEPIEIEENELFPITLTPEILEKNGWDEIMNFYRFSEHDEDDNGWCVDVIIRDGHPTIDIDVNRSYLHCSECDHVHQLQHVIRLFGIKKEITL